MKHGSDGEERFESKDHMDITWFYNDSEEDIRAEMNKDGDKHTKPRYYYDKSRLRRVEEDTNMDGKPDLWEYYDGHLGLFVIPAKAGIQE